MKNTVWENIIKNGVIGLLLIPGYINIGLIVVSVDD